MKRKGITPVIAVVLLLLITVGAVAGAWSMYQQIVSNQGQRDQLAAQRKASNTDFEFASVYESKQGTIKMAVKNVGQRAVNMSQEVSFYVVPPGSQSEMSYTVFTDRFPEWNNPSVDNDCFTYQPNNNILEKGNVYTCDTGVNFPNATASLGLVIDYDAVASKSWRYSCSPQTSSTITC